MSGRVDGCVERHRANARALKDAQAKRDQLTRDLGAAEDALERAQAAVVESRGALVQAAETDQ
jgi:hypothetical protein